MPLPLDAALTLYPLGEESVLFSSRTRKLYGLDRTATAALLRLRRGESPGSITRALGFGEATSPFVTCLAALLTGEEADEEEVYRSELPCSLAVPEHGEALARYRLLETDFAMEGPETLIQECILPYVAHLNTGTSGPIHLLASVKAEGDGWLLRLNGTLQDGALPSERLVPVFYSRLRQFAYQSRPYLLTIHGAVVTGGGENHRPGRTVRLGKEHSGSSSSGPWLRASKR